MFKATTQPFFLLMHIGGPCPGIRDDQVSPCPALHQPSQNPPYPPGRVSERRKHHHKKVHQHHKHRSLSDSEHRHRRSKRRHSPSSSSAEASSEIGSDIDTASDENSVSSTDSSSEQEYSSGKLPNPSAKHRKEL